MGKYLRIFLYRGKSSQELDDFDYEEYLSDGGPELPAYFTRYEPYVSTHNSFMLGHHTLTEKALLYYIKCLKSIYNEAHGSLVYPELEDFLTRDLQNLDKYERDVQDRVDILPQILPSDPSCYLYDIEEAINIYEHFYVTYKFYGIVSVYE